jgi:hypothetical protein
MNLLELSLSRSAKAMRQTHGVLAAERHVQRKEVNKARDVEVAILSERDPMPLACRNEWEKA